MRLFELIWKSTIEEDSDATWEIILKFEPLIRKTSSSDHTYIVDEDLMSYIYMSLYNRIGNFDIFKE